MCDTLLCVWLCLMVREKAGWLSMGLSTLGFTVVWGTPSTCVFLSRYLFVSFSHLHTHTHTHALNQPAGNTVQRFSLSHCGFTNHTASVIPFFLFFHFLIIIKITSFLQTMYCGQTPIYRNSHKEKKHTHTPLLSTVGCM